ncbi:MAG: hypothetical protein IT370_29010 [Deltaproteobacteria bacterium]|nr:hypothetical protein [Deltaproteobacteria bacterium]
MTSGHFIYIPMILAVGIVLGFILGGRAARDALAAKARREEDRVAAKAARAAARAAASAGGKDNAAPADSKEKA